MEADDIIGIYSKSAENQGMRVSILTGGQGCAPACSDLVTVIIPSTSKGKDHNSQIYTRRSNGQIRCGT